MHSGKRFLGALVLLLVFGAFTFSALWADDLDDLRALKERNHAAKEAKMQGKKLIITTTEAQLLYEHDFAREFYPPPNPDLGKFLKALESLPDSIRAQFESQINTPPVKAPSGTGTTGPWLRPDPVPDPLPDAETERFSNNVRVNNVTAGAQIQPSLATDATGRVFACWQEPYGSGRAVMFAKSTDNGLTWSGPVTVDNIGINYAPRVAVSRDGHFVHIVYSTLETHTISTPTGDSTFIEGDVYYARSSTSGISFGSHMALANEDFTFSFPFGLSLCGVSGIYWIYDEGAPDVATDRDGNVYVVYYTMAQEGQIIPYIIALIATIILCLILPEMCSTCDIYGQILALVQSFMQPWYIDDIRTSTTAGAFFNDPIEIANDFYQNNVNPTIALQGNGSNTIAHIAYTHSYGNSIIENSPLGPLFGGADYDVWYLTITNPAFGPAVSGGTSVVAGSDVEYVTHKGIGVDFAGNPHIAYTATNSGGDGDAKYARSTTGGSSWLFNDIHAVGVYDEFEPRVVVDSAGNPNFSWSDNHTGNYEIWFTWSEDYGANLRAAAEQVNQNGTTSNEYWTGLGLWEGDTIKRIDVDWWDERAGSGNPDIWYANMKWWRTNIVVTLQPGAHPMGGAVTMTYVSGGQTVTRPITPGYHIVYHDSATAITLGQQSSGSSTAERWIFSDAGGHTFAPSRPGLTDSVRYWDQLRTTFTAHAANEVPCTAVLPTGLGVTYHYYGSLANTTTVNIRWADVAGDYGYQTPFVTGSNTQWACPTPTGQVQTTPVNPPYFYQYKVNYKTPTSRNPTPCSITVPRWPVIQRMNMGQNGPVTTDTIAWTDCGSVWIYDSTRTVSTTSRWSIPRDSLSGVILSADDIEPPVWIQYKPNVNLVGPYPTGTSECPGGNSVWTEQHQREGQPHPESGLYGIWSDWTDCGSVLEFSQWTICGWATSDPRRFTVTAFFVASIRYGNIVEITITNNFGGVEDGRVIVDGITRAVPAIVGWTPGSTHNIEAMSPQVYTNTRWVFDHWSDGGPQAHPVTVMVPSTFTAYFNVEYQLTILSDHGNPYGDGWYAPGTPVAFGATSPSVPVGGYRYVLLEWQSSDPGGYSGTASGSTVTMNNPITEAATWRTQVQLTVDYTGSPVAPPELGYGGWYNQNAFADLIASQTMDVGTEGVRVFFDHWSSTPEGAIIANADTNVTRVLMDQPYTLTANYITQYRLQVNNPSGLGAPVPGIGYHWYDAGTAVTCSTWIQDGTMYCIGFDGDGSVVPGTNHTTTFTINAPSTITWNWGDQMILIVRSYFLEIDTTAVPPETTIVPVPMFLPPEVQIDPVTGVDTVYYIPGTLVSIVAYIEYPNSPSIWTHYQCRGWTGTGAVPASGTTNTLSFNLTSSSELNFIYRKIHRFKLENPRIFDTPYPPVATYWWPDDTVITATIAASFISGGFTYVCTGYDGQGVVPTRGYGPYWNGHLTQPSLLRWRWSRIDSVGVLNVISAHGGNPNPPIGQNFIELSTPITGNIDPTADGTDGVRYQITGWDLDTNGTHLTGTGTQTIEFQFAHADTFTLTWNWWTWYRLITINGDGTPPTPDTLGHPTNNGRAISNRPDEYWYPSTQVVNARIHGVVDTFFVEGWRLSCDGSGPDTAHTFTMASPCTLWWNWAIHRSALTVISAHGSPVPSVGNHYYPTGTFLTIFAPSPSDSANGTRWICDGWRNGSGSIPATGTTNSYAFNLNDSSSIEWIWHKQYRMIVDSRRDSTGAVFGNPQPPVNHYWYEVGTAVAGTNVLADTVWEGGRNHIYYCIGYWGQGSAPSVSPQREYSFDLDTASLVYWRWAPEESVRFLTVVSPYGSPTPYGMTAWLIGSVVSAQVDTVYTDPVSGDSWLCTGWTGTGSVAPSGADNNTVFVINVNTTITWNWRTVKRLTILNPDGWDSPDPTAGNHYYDPGASVNGSITVNPYQNPLNLADTFYCTGFLGTGDAPVRSYQDEYNFQLNQNSSVRWLWVIDSLMVMLDVYSDYGSPNPYGRTYHVRDSFVTASVDSSVDLGGGMRQTCIGWAGTGSVPSSGTASHVTFRIHQNSTLTWRWSPMLSLTILNPRGFGTPNPSVGTHWYPTGSEVSGSMTPPMVFVEHTPTDIDTFVCMGFAGTGDVPGRSHNMHFDVTMTQTSTLTWMWANIDSVISLRVTSPYGTPDPEIGTTYWYPGEAVHATTDTLVIEGMIYHRCTGWEGSGSAADSGTASVMDFTINVNSTIQWEYGQLYQIMLTFDPGETHGGIPTQIGAGWYVEGDSAVIDTDPTVRGSDGRMYGFTRWTCQPAGANLADDSLSHTALRNIHANYILTAHYAPAKAVMIRKSPYEPYGHISVDSRMSYNVASVATYWAVGTNHAVAVTSPDEYIVGGATMARYQFSYWTDLPPAVQDTHLAIVAHMPASTDTLEDGEFYTLYAIYNTVNRVVVNIYPSSLHTWVSVNGTQYTDSAIIWVPTGGTIQIGAQNSDSTADWRYGWQAWSDGGALSHLTTPITAPITFTAIYGRYWRMGICKDPYHDPGYIYFNAGYYFGDGCMNFWVLDSTRARIGISRWDISTDTTTAWLFTNWTFNVLDTMPATDAFRTTPYIRGTADYVAHYNAQPFQLCVDCSPASWTIPESLRWDSIRVSTTPERISVTNCSIVPSDFGLQIRDEGRAGHWEPGYYQSIDQYVLRARFTYPSTTAPARLDYTPTFDTVLRSTVTYATNLVFGSEGWSVPVGQSQSLWFYLHTPNWTNYGGETAPFHQIIPVRLSIRPSMP